MTDTTTSETSPTASLPATHAASATAAAAPHGAETRAAEARVTEARGDAEPVLRLYEETLSVGKRETVTDRVLLRKTVGTRDEVAEMMLRRGRVEIERVPVGRPVAEAPAMREEGDVLIIPVVEEVLVVEKRLVLKEELHVRRRESVEQVRETVQLRREEVAVERPSLAGRPEQEKQNG